MACFLNLQKQGKETNMAQIISIAVAILLCLCASTSAFAQATQEKDKKKTKNEALVERAMKAVEDKDLDAMDSLVDDNVSLIQPLTFSGSVEQSEMRSFEGKQAVRTFLQGLFTNFKTIKFTNVRMFTTQGEEHVFVQKNSRFIVAGNDAVYQNTYVMKYEFKDGKIVKIYEYFNPVPIAEMFNLKLGKKQ